MRVFQNSNLFGHFLELTGQLSSVGKGPSALRIPLLTKYSHFFSEGFLCFAHIDYFFLESLILLFELIVFGLDPLRF